MGIFNFPIIIDESLELGESISRVWMCSYQESCDAKACNNVAQFVVMQSADGGYICHLYCAEHAATEILRCENTAYPIFHIQRIITLV
jgi:hypothetical protein